MVMNTFDLEQFIQAQENLYSSALSELKSGQKRSHWMWFVFPQIEGLGHSETARFYAIKSTEEAGAYLAHPVLGARLRECTEAVLAYPERSALAIFGHPDNLKFCSSMTLFESVADRPALFTKAIDQFCDGQRDLKTLTILQSLK